MPADAPNILVIRRRYLGDIVLLGTVLRNLRLHWPAARLTVLTERAYAGVLAMNPDADEVLPFPHRLGEWWTLWRRLRRARFTHVLAFDNRDKTAFITLASGAARRYGLRHARPVHLGRCYTHRESVPLAFLDDHHINDLCHRLLVRAGVPIVSHDVVLKPLVADLTFVRALPELATLPKDRPRLLVHPGSRSAFRVWPAESFAAVCNRLQAEGLASITLVAGPAELHLVEEIQRRMTTPVACLRQPFTVPQLGALFASFDRLLCHDSGPMHLAAAVGTRVVALFGSQSRIIFAPVGAGHVTLSPPLPCVNCVAPGTCQRDDAYHNYCVRNITPAEVAAAVRRALQ
ncbi:MAG: glycosyltransferase family 9 protein [Opitutae bacterium]|nr:glycosyltransferase family 9 protein [Opitutae bacterium]